MHLINAPYPHSFSILTGYSKNQNSARITRTYIAHTAHTAHTSVIDYMDQISLGIQKGHSTKSNNTAGRAWSGICGWLGGRGGCAWGRGAGVIFKPWCGMLQSICDVTQQSNISLTSVSELCLCLPLEIYKQLITCGLSDDNKLHHPKVTVNSKKA